MATAVGIKPDSTAGQTSNQTVGFVKTGRDAVAEAVHRILNTSPGERLHEPSFGCRVQELLFEQNDFISISLGSFFIADALQKHEPRIEVLQVTPIPKPDSHELTIEIVFRYIEEPQNILGTVVSI